MHQSQHQYLGVAEVSKICIWNKMETKIEFPVLWKIDILMPDFHISGNTGGRDFMCDNGFTKMNIDN